MQSHLACFVVIIVFLITIVITLIIVIKIYIALTMLDILPAGMMCQTGRVVMMPPFLFSFFFFSILLTKMSDSGCHVIKLHQCNRCDNRSLVLPEVFVCALFCATGVDS